MYKDKKKSLKNPKTKTFVKNAYMRVSESKS